MISSQIARFFDSGATLQSVISFKVRWQPVQSPLARSI
jgi:hypothetical protein